MTTTPYGMRALAGELDKLTRAVTGNRNITLNEVWFKLSQLIEAGHIDKPDAAQRVYQVAAQIGLPDSEIHATMASAGRGGTGKPRPDVPEPGQALAVGGYAFDQPGDTATSPSSSIPPQGLSDKFWEARAPLRQIRQAAWSRGRSAEAVLGAALARLAADTSHLVKLPPIVGARCGLSLIVALTGPPGTGKSSSKSIATELLPARLLEPECDDVPPGSGEGLLETMFDLEVEETPEGKPRRIKRLKRHNVFTYADEGEVLAVQARRNSTSTILPIMRSAFTDATLGQANAAEDRKRRIPAGQYVFGVVLGIQPNKADLLFADAGGGTPQRFLWMPTDTPVPAPADRPDWPDGPLVRAELPVGGTTDTDHRGRRHFQIPEHIQAEVREADHARQQHGCDPMDEHTDLIRLKVAAILAVLDGRLDINLKDWQLAEVIRDLSVATRTRTQAALARHRAEDNRRRGEAQGEREIIVDAKRDQVSLDKVRSAILRRLSVVGDDGEVEGKLRVNALAPAQRGQFSTAIGQLVDEGKVSSEQTAKSVLYRRKEDQ